MPDQNLSESGYLQETSNTSPHVSDKEVEEAINNAKFKDKVDLLPEPDKRRVQEAVRLTLMFGKQSDHIIQKDHTVLALASELSNTVAETDREITKDQGWKSAAMTNLLTLSTTDNLEERKKTATTMEVAVNGNFRTLWRSQDRYSEIIVRSPNVPPETKGYLSQRHTALNDLQDKKSHLHTLALSIFERPVQGV